MYRPSPGTVGIDQRADATGAQPSQLLDRVGDAHLLVPVALAPGVAVVLPGLGVEHEDVLVHERRAEVGDVDGSAYGLDAAHALAPQPSCLIGSLPSQPTAARYISV